jgi:competence protein ComEA
MIISESKLKGIIAVCLVLAVIPFISLISHSVVKYKIPVFADQCKDCLTIEIVEGKQSAGLYFVPPGTSVNQLLKSVGIEETSKNNIKLNTGMKLTSNPESVNNDIIITEMPNAAKISSGMSIDINKAKLEDLIMIKGIGPVTAQRIVELRDKLHGIKDMKQLMEIKGIKEKKIIKIRKYLYVKNVKK